MKEKIKLPREKPEVEFECECGEKFTTREYRYEIKGRHYLLFSTCPKCGKK